MYHLRLCNVFVFGVNLKVSTSSGGKSNESLVKINIFSTKYFAQIQLTNCHFGVIISGSERFQIKTPIPSELSVALCIRPNVI